MKSSTILALAAFFALSVAVPLEKRDILTVIDTMNVVETVDVVTTIFVAPGDPRLLAQQAAMKPQVPATAPAHSTAPALAFIAPQTRVSATPGPAPAIPQIKAVLKPIPAAAAAPVSSPAPVATPQKLDAATPAAEKVAEPVEQQAAPASSPSIPSTSSSDTGLSGAACGVKGGKCIAGDVTTFDGGASAGACGYVDSTKDANYFALAVGMMGSASNDGGISDNPYCNRTADIIYNGVTHHATLTDKCMGCAGGDQSLDLSLTLFEAIFSTDTGNFHNIEWHFTSDPTPV